MFLPVPLSAQFIEKLRLSLASEEFVKLTLSGYAGPEAGLRNVYGRLVLLREGLQLSLLWRYQTRDVTKNFPVPDGITQIAALLEGGFTHAHLFTGTGDWRWRSDGSLKRSRPVFSGAPEPVHDRKKKRAAEVMQAPFLQALGVTNSGGDPRPGQAGKLRQIQKFVELIASLAPVLPPKLRVLDLGAGKGYLTFALAQFLRQRGTEAEIVGVERRGDLVELTNRVARETGFPQLRFVTALDDDHPLDWVIALHACDTATDEAIFRGVRAGAELIVTAPCCHKEVRGQMQPPSLLSPLLRHGILLEREAASLTDAIRALALEIHGYKASVFEFISSEHTDKNLMIAAQKRKEPRAVELLRAQLAELLGFYGVRTQRLLELLHDASLHAA